MHLAPTHALHCKSLRRAATTRFLPTRAILVATITTTTGWHLPDRTQMGEVIDKWTSQRPRATFFAGRHSYNLPTCTGTYMRILPAALGPQCRGGTSRGSTTSSATTRASPWVVGTELAHTPPTACWTSRPASPTTKVRWLALSVLVRGSQARAVLGPNAKTFTTCAHLDAAHGGWLPTPATMHLKVFTETGDTEICGKSWSQYFTSYKGRDVGSTIAKWPSDKDLVASARALLDF